MIYDNITQLIGKTPLLNLSRIDLPTNTRLLVKLEMFNPGGSVKDRIARQMVEKAEKNGQLKPGGTIIEPTSGNTGIGLALVGAERGYNVILTMPDTMSQERRSLLKAYGAELILTPGEDGMKGAIDKAEKLAEENEDYFIPRQFENSANPEAHQETTAKEIIKNVDGKIDYLVVGVGTGGTLTGVGSILKEHYPEMEIIAVEPEGSAVLSGEEAGPHGIQGIGAGFIPNILKENLIDKIIRVSRENAVNTARLVAKNEGVLGGISSGANIAASLRLAEKLNENSSDEPNTILTFAPDTGERYLSTDLFSE